MQNKNFLLFIVLSALILLTWAVLSKYVFPPPVKDKTAEVASKEEAKKDKDKKPDDKKKPEEKKKPDKKPERPPVAGLKLPPETPEKELIELGDGDEKSKFHLRVILDPRGASVQSVLLNKFQAADDRGQPEWLDPDTKKKKKPLELVPAELNRLAPSFLLFSYDVNDPTDDKPRDRLGRIKWTLVGEKKVVTLENGLRRESMSFEAKTLQGVIVTKTYSVTEGDYHVGLAVKMRRDLDSKSVPVSVKFRYQLAGAHGLPVEGKWYTSTFRNALIAWIDGGQTVRRDLQDLRQISNWGGGNKIEARKEDQTSLIYAGVAVQYFASVIVVDNKQDHQKFLSQARPTLETELTKGVVTSVAEDGTSFVLKPQGGAEETFAVPEGSFRVRVRHGLPKGARVSVLHHTGSFTENGGYPEIATDFFPESEDERPALWVDDVTVRVSTEPVELRGTDEVVHKYLLYHGPVKVSQLSGPPGFSAKPLDEGGVDPNLVNRYHDKLHLNTLTDYHTPGVMGTFASKIYWTDLVIKCTNVMHVVLGYIHAVIPSFGLCIIVLTVLVRGMMFPLSRKQALMAMKMQQLAPEMKKLQEKFKDDRQALGMAQMDLYRKHGVNPLGSCWVLLLQMPIFMGLYFALQESIHFRLAEFWPTWINNLAAPDMLLYWSQSIPFISRVSDYGSFFYLGPYFNLLPVIAVALMIAQQKMMTPPPADEQQAMQQKMMKYMMIFFGLMFYKVAAGLCIYFIASSVWGFCERKLLPKKKPEVGEVSSDGYFQKLLNRARGEQVTTAPATSTNVVAANGGITSAPAVETRGRTRGKQRNKRRQGSASGADAVTENPSLLGRWRKRLREWWIAVLKEAEKKNRG
jgi:YidC/Oxa1 family membrane protein insertase